MRIPLHSFLFLLVLCLGLFSCFGSSTGFADEPKPYFSQTPLKASGGCLAVAQPMKKTGGWHGVYRAADDFTLVNDTTIAEVSWWGASYDGRHGEDDGLDQVMGFAINIYEDHPDLKKPGRLLHRTIVPLNRTSPRRTKFEVLGGSDVMKFNASLNVAFNAKAKNRYWFSVSAYLSGEPMWVWEGGGGNGEYAIDYGVNGIWGDQPKRWRPVDLAFELRGKTDLQKDLSEQVKKEEGKVASGAAQIKLLVKQLRHDDYVEREAAEIKLTKIGQPAATFLTPHIKHDDPEIRYRVRRILTKCYVLDESKPMTIHTLKKGEEVNEVAKLYGVAKEAITSANGLGEQSPKVGIMLFIPQLNRE